MGGRRSTNVPSPFVSRAGVKLEHAVCAFGLDISGLACADFGCHVGGFTDCLLRHGAAKVYAVDTGYGVLDYALRTDPRVVVMERTNVLHAPSPTEPVDLVTIDLGWTRQRHAIPTALAWLAPEGRIITLVKPHYELDDAEKASRLVNGVLAPEHAAKVLKEVLASFPGLGADAVATTPSPIEGAKSARRGHGEGNREYLVLAVKKPGNERAR
ncbi:MAG: SAM-dependent methyltransferase [Planctomycetota bacterium]|jgi:23S rRNA (cytidine1920-2'-O)/16S rRNA (cytidine1409-2'-O)-methyltransferase